MSRELAIVGASGHGKVVADLAEQLGWVVRFYDDAYPSKTHVEHWPILGTCADLVALNIADAELSLNAVIAIGNNEIRQQKLTLLQFNNFNIITLIHPSAVISQYATIAPGSVVFAGAVINAFAKVGAGCIINTAAIIDHDCHISDFAHICPNSALAGGVVVGTKSLVGIGSQVKQLIMIGDNCIIGAGSTVVKNVSDNIIVFGSPALPR